MALFVSEEKNLSNIQKDKMSLLDQLYDPPLEHGL
jgi:hypothetical protein